MNRIGIRKEMDNKEVGTIIAYRNATDMDVLFPDGGVAEHVRWSHFKDGAVSSPLKKASARHVGETSVNTNGHRMTIQAWRTQKDIDVRFDDGTVKEHVRYDAFRNGNVQHPDDMAEKKHLGEAFQANCDLRAEIIAWRSWNDVDVQFENGKIGHHKSYDNIRSGQIVYDGYETKRTPDSVIGMTTYHKRTGQNMTIIGTDGNLRHLIVRFEDGTTVKDVSIQKFENGSCQYPGRTNVRYEREGETRMSSCGLKMKITDYRKARDMTVAFSDGSANSHASYDDFLAGNVWPEQLSRVKKRGNFLGYQVSFAFRDENNTYYMCCDPETGEMDILNTDQMIAKKHIQTIF